MKKLLKLLTLFVFICLTFTVLATQGFSAQAKGTISLAAKNTVDGVSLSWNGDETLSYSVYRKTESGKFVKLKKVKDAKYTDTEAESGIKYIYRVKDSNKTTSKDISVIYMESPQIKKAVNTKNGITVKWSGVKGAQKYAVYRKSVGQKLKKIGTSESCSFTDSTAKTGVKYYYTVKAYKDGYISAAQSKVSAIKLANPKIISVTNQANGLQINWKKAEGAETYTIYRRQYGKTNWKKITSVSADTLTYTDTAVTSGVKYSYYIKSLSGECTSLYKDKFTSRTYLAVPAELSLDQSGKSITLTWSAVKGATKYEIFRKTADAEWKKYKSLDSKTLKYSETLSTISKKVCFKVRAVSGKACGLFSDEVTTRFVDPNKPMVALTYDDGPHPTHTPAILDVLEKYGARATFFVVGSRITSYSSCLVRQNKLGCEIGNHSYSHVSLSSSSDATVIKQISDTDALIKKYSGQTCRIARAPGGSVGKASRLISKPFIQWSVDTMDWKYRSSSHVVSHIKSTVRDGSIILMHDLYGSTASATETIVPWLINQGYQLVTVSEMMDAKGINMANGQVYYNGYA